MNMFEDVIAPYLCIGYNNNSIVTVEDGDGHDVATEPFIVANLDGGQLTVSFAIEWKTPNQVWKFIFQSAIVRSKHGTFHCTVIRL